MHDFSQIVSLVKAASDATQNVMGSPLRRIKAARDLLCKSADFGSDNTAAFEKAFGAVAYTYLQEKVPNLIQYIVGFQLIDNDQEANEAFGMFVAKIGNSVIDIPMFFKNNELKGHVLMRLRDPDIVLPLREAFLDYVISRMPQDIGDTTLESEQISNVQSQPDMTSFDPTQMMSGKLASEIGEMSKWAMDYKVPEAYAALRCEPSHLQLAIDVKNKTAASKIVNLVDFISTNKEFVKAAAEMADKYPVFERGMQRIYGQDWFSKAINKLADNMCPGDPITLADDKDLLKLADDSVINASYVAVHTSVPSFADDEETELALTEIHKFGDYIEDTRIPSEVVDVVEITEPIDLSPPPVSGIYNVLMSNGDFERKIVVVSNTVIGGSAPSNKDLIIDPSTRQACFINRNNYAVGERQGGESFDATIEWNKLLAEAKSSPATGDVGIFLTKSGQSTGLIRIEEKQSDDSYAIGRASHYDLEIGGCEYDGMAHRRNNHPETLRMYEGTSGSRIHETNTVLSVPSSAKFLKLYSNNYEDIRPSDSYEDSRPRKLDVCQTGSLSFNDLFKATRVKLRKLSSDSFELNGKNMNASQLRKTLVFSAGLSKAASQMLLDQPHGTHRYLFVPASAQVSLGALIKQANAAYNEPYLPFPEFEGPYSGNTGNYQVVDGDQQRIEQAPYDPTRQPLQEGEDPHDMLNLGAGGGEEVAQDTGLWDVMGLKNIVTNSRTDSDIRLTSKQLLSTINRLGRQIMAFYANTDEYADVYGDDEIDTLEDLLLNTFEGAGDLFIAMTRKSAGTDSELDIATLASSMPSM
jgi:hypothetical protein